MEIMDIAFPNLGIYLRNMPKSFTVFGFEIALYGVIIGIVCIFYQEMMLFIQSKSTVYKGLHRVTV